MTDAIDKTLPLVELHRHLDGSIRPQTIWDLSIKNGIDLGVDNIEALTAKVQIHDKTSDLLAFLSKLDTGVSVLSALEDCQRIAYENVEDAARENIDYIELRFSPYYMAHTHNLPLSGVVEAVIDGIRSATRKFPVRAELIGILSRTFGAKTCMEELDALLTQKDAICGLDLAGDEINYPANNFVSHFSKARDVGWNITVHAGEAAGPESIWDAINKLGATRIGHGVAAIQDTSLMEYIAKNNIGIESCPTSNYQTATVSDIRHHPMKTFLQNDIAVTLSTDDPGVSAITLSDEYSVARDVIGLSKQQLSQIQLNGLEQAFISAADKETLRLKSQLQSSQSL